jgi:hypothetical protein
MNMPTTCSDAHVIVARRPRDVPVLSWTKICSLPSTKSEKNDKTTTSNQHPRSRRITSPRPPVTSQIKDGNGHGMGKVEQYHIHTCIVDGYKILPVPVPTGMNIYPCPYPAGTHTHWVPNRWIKYYTCYSLFYFDR